MTNIPIDWTFEERKAHLIISLFIEPADQDYLAARWAYKNCLFNVYYWCAAQALEKYMKSILLLNNISVLNVGHNINELFKRITAMDAASDIAITVALPDTLGMGRDNWDGKPVSDFIDYMQQYGSTENRYGAIGTFINGPVIHILDKLCFELRGFIRKRNFIGCEIYRKMSDLSHDILKKTDERWMISCHLILESLYFKNYRVGQNDETRKCFSNMNVAFFRDRNPDDQTFGGKYFHGSPLYNQLVRFTQIDKRPENLDKVDRLREWVKANVPINKEIMKELGLK